MADYSCFGGEVPQERTNYPAASALAATPAPGILPAAGTCVI